MLDNRGFKVVVAFVGVVLWLLPQEVLGEDVEIKNRLSYISKVIGVIEGSIIKIEGDVRFVKRQAEKTTAEAHLSAKRLDHLEEKIKSVENLLNTIAIGVAKANGSLERIEKDLEGLFRGSCSNALLCKRKK
ncbi:hypothetical protein M1N16_04675 [Nitrospinaceae bacterium]|nr:hypothetical protein [Nitrospinaceae bacterium]